MKTCVPVTSDGLIDPRWGRADRLAIADVSDGEIQDWQEFDVGWNAAHDQGTEGSHHSRVARFLLDHDVKVVVANHMGEPMVHMLKEMEIEVRLGASGDARQAATSSNA
jgi:predicted Fe-Mo cluster-binding NifX family protein